jgi:hypothetical protein
MKKCMIFIIVPMLFGVALVLPGFSQDSGSGTDHSEHVGINIHESTIEGYRFAYHLIDIRKNPEEAMKDMKDMKGSKEADMTHHLMVYVMGPDNHAAEAAKLGYLVEGPDGGKQKLMTMGMQGAYGANVNFKNKGSYTIKTKFIVGDKKLFDKFSYEVE